MSALAQPERERWLAIFLATDEAVARCVSSGTIPQGAALAILTEFSRPADRYDARLANDMAPRASAGAITPTLSDEQLVAAYDLALEQSTESEVGG